MTTSEAFVSLYQAEAILLSFMYIMGSVSHIFKLNQALNLKLLCFPRLSEL